jgi:hypothetical protein
MRTRFRITLLSLLTFLTIGAVGPALAHATGAVWTVNGVPIAEPVEVGTKGSLTFKIIQPSGKEVKFTCEVKDTEKLLLAGKNEFTAFEFVNCKVEVPAKECTATVTAEKLPWATQLWFNGVEFFVLIKGIKIKVVLAGKECPEPLEHTLEGNLEGVWNGTGLTFPATPLRGTTLAPVGGKSVVASGSDTFELAKGTLGVTSQASWFVNGTKLPAGSKQALSTTARVASAPVLNVPSLNIKISCSGLSGESPEIVGTTTGKAKSLIFEKCSEIAPAKCSVETTIPTLAVQADPFFNVLQEDRVQFKPQSGTTFATIDFLGSECPVAGEKPVKGAVAVNAPTDQTELAEQPIEGLGTVENNSLEITGDKGYIEGGKAFLKLASGAKWSFQE